MNLIYFYCGVILTTTSLCKRDKPNSLYYKWVFVSFFFINASDRIGRLRTVSKWWKGQEGGGKGRGGLSQFLYHNWKAIERDTEYNNPFLSSNVIQFFQHLLMWYHIKLQGSFWLNRICGQWIYLLCSPFLIDKYKALLLVNLVSPGNHATHRVDRQTDSILFCLELLEN